MKYCKKCGAQLADDDDYCYFCGSSLEEEKKEEKQEYQYYRYSEQDSYTPPVRNGLAMAGLIVSIFSPIVGLTLSIIGLNRAKALNGAGRGQAIAGIIISILNMVITFMVYFVIVATYGGE